MENNRKRVAGIGSVLVDIVLQADDGFIEKADAVKGGMIYVEPDHIEKTLSDAESSPVVVPGGSACNTIIGVGRLGGEAKFVGKCGKGPMAELFESDLKKNGVAPVLMRSDSPTGRVLSIVTPDAQRTMLTYLGASAEIAPEEITPDLFGDTAIVHLEGYLLFNRSLISSALEAVKKSGARVSLDLASFTVVEEAGEFLDDLVTEYVDILIANEDEARAYTGHSDETLAVRALSEKAETAVLKVGERGSYIASEGRTVRIPPKGGGAAVDTTGAGDLWAAGFLYGLANGFPVEFAGELGSLCGYEVCRVMGAKITDDGWERIRGFFAN